MGCNCKKKQVVQVPQTPEELHTQEMNKWNGGAPIIEEFYTEEIDNHILVPKPLTEEEVDWFNNIDVIEPLKEDE